MSVSVSGNLTETWQLTLSAPLTDEKVTDKMRTRWFTGYSAAEGLAVFEFLVDSISPEDL